MADSQTVYTGGQSWVGGQTLQNPAHLPAFRRGEKQEQST